MFHGKRPAPGRRSSRARHAGDSGARCRALRPGASGNSPALHFGPAESTGSPKGGRQPHRSPLAQSHQLRLAGCEEPSPTPAFNRGTQRCSLGAAVSGSPQPGLRGSQGLGPPQQRCPGSARRPARGAGTPGGVRLLLTSVGDREHLGSCSSQVPGEVKAQLPRDALLNPKGTDRSLENPVFLPQWGWEFPTGAVPCALCWETSPRAGAEKGPFRASVFLFGCS